jgi:hypothetical protein
VALALELVGVGERDAAQHHRAAVLVDEVVALHADAREPGVGIRPGGRPGRRAGTDGQEE